MLTIKREYWHMSQVVTKALGGCLSCPPPTTAKTRRHLTQQAGRREGSRPIASPPEQQVCPQERLRGGRLSGFQKNLANGLHCSQTSNPGESA